MTTDSIPRAAPAVPAPVAPDIPETVARLRATFATGVIKEVSAGGDDQADPTRRHELHVPPVYRDGEDAGAS